MAKLDHREITAEIISIGDELLIGQTVNTNAGWMGEQLGLIGIRPKRVLTIGDDAQDQFGTYNGFIGCRADCRWAWADE
ncbi:MAG: hypothetical protein IPI81_02425 [Flavobacteriales bacterium]|nr:hypothetical protein [Flavobacteriales bacterium]